MCAMEECEDYGDYDMDDADFSSGAAEERAQAPRAAIA